MTFEFVCMRVVANTLSCVAAVVYRPGSECVIKDKISFIHIDKRDDQPNSITVNTANNQMNRTTTYVGPISLIHTHAFSTLQHKS